MGMTGAYERNLDAKGRLSLPAPLREELGEHVRVFKALDVDALYVFSAEAFDKWVEGLFAGREGHEGFNPRDINDQKLMGAINKPALTELLGIEEPQKLAFMVAFGYPTHKADIVPMTEQTGVKYYLDENRDYCVPKRSAEEIARSL